MARYTSRRTIIISSRNDEMFREHLEKRGRESVPIYTSPDNNQIFSPEQRNSFDYRAYVWRSGDKLRKLSADFYGDSYFWWIIGWFNMKPTDAHWKAGDIAYIPENLEQVLAFYGY